MKRKFVILFMILSTQVRAQNLSFNWVRQMGGASNDFCHAITTDALGNVYTTGFFIGTTDFDPGPGVFNFQSAGMLDVFISKLDGTGRFVWARQLGGIYNDYSYALAVDGIGNVYTVGFFSGTVDFNPGPAVFNLSADDVQTVFVSKLDANGNFVWAKKLGGNNFADPGSCSVAIDGSGNVYTTSRFSGTADFDPGPGVFNLSSAGLQDIFVSKLDASGNFVWAKQLGGPGYDLSYSIALDHADNVYLAGNFTESSDFDPGAGVYALNSLGGVDAFVAKLDVNGSLIWARQMGGIYSDGATAIAVDESGSVHTTGNFVGSADFDPGPATFQLGSAIISQYAFVSALDPSGNFIWAKQLGAGSDFTTGTSIALDPSGHIYATGGFHSTADFDPSECVFNLHSSGDFDIYVSKLDATGKFIWAKRMGGTEYDLGTSIACDPSGNMLVAGNFSSTPDFDPGSGVYQIAPFGQDDVFVLKMSPCVDGTSSTLKATACSSYTINCQTFSASGMYYVMFENSAGCDSVVTLDLTILNTPVSYTFSVAACNSYSWNGQTITASGVYTDSLIASTGCDSIVTMNLTISNGASAAAINIETCGSYSLNGQTLTASGTYTDTLVAANGCDSVVTLQLSVKHQSNSSVAKTICQGENFEGYTISGTYVDTLISANGCDSIRTLQLIVVSVPAPDLGIDKALCTADTLVLDPGQYSAYLWQDGSSQNNFTVKHPGLYSVTVSNECGSAKDEIMIKEGFCDIVFPTAFTPNNDGKNDIFKALGTPNLSEYHFAVYNRWGQKLFETSELSKGWDGKFRGQLQEYGAYVWYCRYKKSNTSKASTIKGTTTLIR